MIVSSHVITVVGMLVVFSFPFTARRDHERLLRPRAPLLAPGEKWLVLPVPGRRGSSRGAEIAAAIAAAHDRRS